MNSICLASYESLCDEIGKLEKGQNLIKAIGHNKYISHKLATPVDAPFIIKRLREKKWLVFDVRSTKSIIKFGNIGNTIDIASYKLNSSQNKFTLSNLMNLFKNRKHKRYLDKRGILDFKFKEDLQEYNYIVFCNGSGCHRSSLSACQLRRMGVPFEQVYIGLGGANELIENGASFR